MIDANAIIDNICNKLGTTADILVPELVRYKEYSYLAGFIICIICIVISVILIWIGRKISEKHDSDEEDYLGFYFFGGIGLLTSLVVIIVQIHGFIVWHNAPMGAVVNYVISSL